MRKTLNYNTPASWGVSLALLLGLSACTKSASDGSATASTPKEAASQLQEAFVSAKVEIKNDAKVASEALRTADYEKAVQSLFAPEQFKNWTADERLSARPFEKYDAGIRFSGEYVIPEDHLEEREIVFETVLRESQTYREQLPKSDYRNIAVRTSCLWQPKAVLLANWSLFGSQSYYKPLRRRREESHPNYVKVAEPGFNLSMNEAVNGKFVSAVLDGVGEGQMTYAEALEVSKQIKDAQILIRSKVDVIPT